MRKIVLLIIVMFVLGASLIGCSENTDTSHQVFKADVIGTKDGLLITPDKDSIEYSSSDRIYVATREAEIAPDKGNTIDVDILRPGDRIKVSYDGLIAESYPAQITADKIELLGRNKSIDGFLALIDDIYQEDSALNSDISMIAFDTTGWTMLSEIETEIVLSIVKDEYALDVVIGTFDELADQGLIDRDNLYFKEGVLIVMEEIEVNNDKDIIKCSIRKWKSGKGAIGWEAVARFDKDTWKISRNKMWIS